jgi:predicted nucleic acid-binding protein
VFILDTDVISLMFRFPGQQSLLEQRVKMTPYEHIYATAISVEESIMGAFKLRDNKNNPVACYQFLAKIPAVYARYQILPYTAEAIEIFNGLSAAIKRIAGANDSKIAAIALSPGYTVVTRNISHFEQTGVPCIDWTKP